MQKIVLTLAISAVLLAACKKKEEAAPVDPAQPVSTATAPAAPEAPAPQPAATATQAFDLNAVPVSDTPLGEWPYIALPAGYRYGQADLKAATKDLARVPVWTGGELLWVEGKVFVDPIRNDDGKTYSRFEVRKAIEQAVTAIGGQRIGERTFDEAMYRQNEKALKQFTAEFSDMANAYWYDEDADTYLVRHADKAVWFVTTASNDRTVLMVAEGPLPQPAAP